MPVHADSLLHPSLRSRAAPLLLSPQEALRSVDFDYAGSTNSFGDNQLQADLHADEVIFSALRGTPQVASASSEEQTDIIPLNPGGEYSVSRTGRMLHPATVDVPKRLLCNNLCSRAGGWGWGMWFAHWHRGDTPGSAAYACLPCVHVFTCTQHQQPTCLVPSLTEGCHRRSTGGV